HAATMHMGIGYSNEVIELHVARGLEYRGHRRDEGEFLEVFPLSLMEALQMVGDGRITDAKTSISLLWLERFRERWA
ncbi:MAG: hypothetical protein JNK75_01785, partial [Betaproteobacteria bacterium]|nr:hypothetical protein [Betaproteobacteria bacterium]